MNFFKTILASVLGFWIAAITILLIVVAVAARFSVGEIAEVHDNSILELDGFEISKDYVPSGEESLVQLLNFDNQIGFNQIIRVIERAKRDPKIKAISIKKIPEGMGWAQAAELRKELQSFKESGKKIWAYGDFYTQKGYYLSTVSDSLYMSPVGSVELKGLHSEVLFFKDFQEKYGVKMEVIRHGKYKSAVEPFIANEMSPSNRLQISELIHSLWNQVKQSIEVSRGINSEQVVLNLQGRLPKMALKNKLIDVLTYEDDYTNKFNRGQYLNTYLNR